MPQAPSRLPSFITWLSPFAAPCGERGHSGGGEVDLKLGMSAREFVEAYSPMVVDCTYDDDAPGGGAMEE